MNKTATKKEKQDVLKTVFEWAELLVISIAIVMVVLTCIARYSPVNGASMNETLQHGDVLILSDFLYNPKKGDIIVFQSEATGYHNPYVKRIIATENQTVDYNRATGQVTVDGTALEEDYVVYKGMQNNYANVEFPYTVPEGHVFVMGDNRWNSRDSRAIGAVDERNIIGRVVFRLTPNTGKVN